MKICRVTTYAVWVDDEAERQRCEAAGGVFNALESAGVDLGQGASSEYDSKLLKYSVSVYHEMEVPS